METTEYKDWARSDNFIDPKTGEPFKANNFPLIDFQLDVNVVSLKTVNTKGSRWENDMRRHIDALQSAAVTVGELPAKKILDVRVQPGGLKDAAHLIDYGSRRGITVIVKEFGGVSVTVQVEVVFDGEPSGGAQEVWELLLRGRLGLNSKAMMIDGFSGNRIRAEEIFEYLKKKSNVAFSGNLWKGVYRVFLCCGL